jgi:hypothetical protein
MRALLRSAACVGALLPFVLLVAGSALAVTVTSAVNSDRNTISTGTASQDPYCSGTYLTITGTGFVEDGGVTGVMIANVPAVNVRVGSDKTLYAQVGAKATDGPVIVTTKAGSAQAPQTYVIMPCAATPVTTKPVISYYQLPSQTQGHQSVKVKGGKNFYIGGTSLLAVTSVTVGGKPATFAVASDYNLYVTMPKTAANGKLAVKVVAQGGTTLAPSTLTLTKTA